MTSQTKTCPRCKGSITNQRRKYCSDSCRYWYNAIRKEKESHLPPVRKRNANYFHMITGAQPNSLRGHGGRNHKGAMAARVYIYTEEIVEVNYANLLRHFTGTKYDLQVARRCDGSTITKKQFENWPKM